MSPDAVAALGAFLSGVGSVLCGWLVIRAQRKRDEERCAQRIEEIRAALREGVQLARESG